MRLPLFGLFLRAACAFSVPSLRRLSENILFSAAIAEDDYGNRLALRSSTVGDLTAHPDERVERIVRDLARDHSLDERDRPFASVRYWAPFVLVGDWG
jgi:hypothetical protein